LWLWLWLWLWLVGWSLGGWFLRSVDRRGLNCLLGIASHRIASHRLASHCMASVRSIDPSCARSVRSAEVGGWILMIDCTGHGCSHSSNPIQSIAMRCANFGENVARRLWTPHGTECEKQHNTTQHNTTQRTNREAFEHCVVSLSHASRMLFFCESYQHLTSPQHTSPQHTSPHLTATHRNTP